MSTGIGVGISSVFTSRPAGGPSVVLEYSTSDYCETQTPSVITPTVIQPAPPAGVFTSSGSGLVVNPNSGVFNIGISNIGNYIITYTVAGVGSANFPVNISALDDSSFSYSASSFRQNASNPAPTITGLVGGVFSGPTGIIFSDSGTNTNSSSGIINLAASTVGGPYTITYTTTGNCPSSSTFNVTVQVALSITYSAASFCEDGGNTAAPTVVGDPGSGTFASTTGLTINSTTGVINTDTSTPDDNTPYTVTYTASTGETATTTVTIKNLDNATFSYSASSFCENASNQTPSITTPGGTFSAAPAVDSDASAFFSRVTTAGGSLSTTEEQAVNTLVTDLKSANIWSKMSAIYPLVGASAAACAQNLKSSSYTGTFAGGWTYASTGITGNGTNNRMDTALTPSTELSLNSTHLSVYSRTDTPTVTGDVDMGVNATAYTLIEIWGGNFYSLINQNATGSFVSVSTSLGHFIGSRISSSEVKGFRNGSSILTSSTNSTNLATANIALAAMGAAGYSSAREYAFASIGEGLTDAEVSDFYTAVQAFQTTLSRNV